MPFLIVLNNQEMLSFAALPVPENNLLKCDSEKLSELNPDHRLCILEDLPELQCSSDDVQYLTTSGNKVTSITMQDLVLRA